MRNWNVFVAKSKTKRVNIHLTICKLEGLPVPDEAADEKGNMIQVHIEWGVSKKNFLFRKAADREYTSRQRLNSDGCVHWDEGFDHVCKLKQKGSDVFESWKINLNIHLMYRSMTLQKDTKMIFNKYQQSHEHINKHVFAQVSLDIAEYADPTEGYNKDVELPFKCTSGGSAFDAKLTVKISVFLLQNKHKKSIVHNASPTHLLQLMGSCATAQEETINTTTSSISDSDDDPDPSYKSIFTTNLLINSLLDDRVIYSNSKNENWEDNKSQYFRRTRKPSLVRFLSWNNRLYHRETNLSRDGPLLEKDCKEDGDDNSGMLHPELDQVNHNSHPDEPLSSDRFDIGIWENRRLISRDRKLELVADIFLASIDQCSEKASGEGACTVLAVVIANWLHQNPGMLPLKCQFDKLIRDGSLEWRNLCKEEIHQEKFSDQHFDLDTVIEEQVRPLVVVPAKSHIGFFELGNTHSQLEFLQGVKSFDTVWNELQSGYSMRGDIYIGGWNDHFFVLKIEEDAIYMIDTLGERLTEGCDKAYILKFDKASKVYRVQEESQDRSSKQDMGDTGEGQDTANTEEESMKSCIELISEGRSCCKEFIKEFLAAIPLRELQDNMERGTASSAPIHNLLQIEFHYTTPCTRYTAKHEDRSTSTSNYVLGQG